MSTSSGKRQPLATNPSDNPPAESAVKRPRLNEDDDDDEPVLQSPVLPSPAVGGGKQPADTEPAKAPTDDEEEEWLESGHPYIGAAIRRFFDAGVSDGRVTKWLPEAEGEPALWHVVHDDGDEEDLDEDEVRAAIKAIEEEADDEHRPARAGISDEVKAAKQAIHAQEDCGTCGNCLDKPKYGGENKKRQACKLKLDQIKRLPPELGGKAAKPPKEPKAAKEPKPPKGAKAKGKQPAAKAGSGIDPSSFVIDTEEGVAGAAVAAVELNSIEKILDGRPREAAGGLPGEEEYLCKAKGLAYVHSQWRTVAEIEGDGRLSKQRLTNFVRKREKDGGLVDPYLACMEVESVIAVHREAAPPPPPSPKKKKQAAPAPASGEEGDEAESEEVEEVEEAEEEAEGGGSMEVEGAEEDEAVEEMAVAPPKPDDDGGDDDEGEEDEGDDDIETYYLVKWRGLGYDGCTWEYGRIAGAEAIQAYEERERVVAARPTTEAEAPTPSEDVPEVFKGGRTLRDYQRAGVRWLRFNYAQGRGVILGDEMGLGKTAQSATMLHCLHSFHKAKGPYLVVVPLSTVTHWQREIRDWTSLHAVLFHGPAEAREVLLDYEWAPKPRPLGAKAASNFGRVSWGNTLARPKFDVCITTYETFTACVDIFRKVTQWQYLILDEAHRLKNKFGKALAALQSLGRVPTLALTGTPLQNNVGELWTILNLLDAPSFPSLDDFLEQYGDMTSAAQVHSAAPPPPPPPFCSVSAPFLLRFCSVSAPFLLSSAPFCSASAPFSAPVCSLLSPSEPF